MEPVDGGAKGLEYEVFAGKDAKASSVHDSKCQAGVSYQLLGLVWHSIDIHIHIYIYMYTHIIYIYIYIYMYVYMYIQIVNSILCIAAVSLRAPPR